MRNLLVLIIAVIVLALVNFEIYQKKEQLLAEGTTVLLELAPRDPRSIMQGDYMVLRYHIARLPALSKVEKDGYLVIERDEKQANESLLRFRKRQRDIRLGAESFFFQEGHAEYYNNARYGELRVAPSGDSVLVGLRDAELKPLGPPTNVEEIEEKTDPSF